MYRGDATRSGAVWVTLPDAPKQQWAAQIGGRLTQPVIAGGQLFVASVDAHTVFARSAADGRPRWQYSAGGRIDSSPTIYRGRVYFGAADGWVYCLDAADGALAWRRRASPKDRLIAAYGQLESIWPVHGSVLVQNDTLYVTAGRSSYLDGGIALYCLDPATGAELSKTVLCHLDPETGQQLVPEARFNMEGTTSDVLVGDGESVYLKYFGFDRSGNRIEATNPHLFSITGLLGEQWFVRSYWVIGAGMPGAGWGGWASAANTFPSGRILSFDKNRAYGYGRREVAPGPVGHRADVYQLFCMDRKAAPSQPASQTSQAGKKARRGKAAPKKGAPLWSDPKSLIVRAMVLGGDRLAIAGPVDVGQKAPEILAYRNEAEAVAGFEGKKGVYLRVVSAIDGRQVWETKLNSVPVFDGMAAAGEKIYISQKDGTLACFGDEN
jgi:outer membrane protein assembly factor BamB